MVLDDVIGLLLDIENEFKGKKQVILGMFRITEIREMLENYYDGDEGPVECGFCHDIMRRRSAIMNKKYVYLCGSCAELLDGLIDEEE